MAAQKVSPVFDLEQISAATRNDLMTVIHGEVTTFFAQPGVAEAFEEWLKNKRKEKTNESTRSNN